ncbi:MAG: cobalamin biosynthesis protein CobD [Firmicutes bacterium]|nr:cobalamin biosynthesis protein CobD [Bacillota bacterium]
MWLIWPAWPQVVLVVVAYMLDLVMGDPPWMPHPVVGLGKLISCLEKPARRLARTGWQERVSGVFIAVFVVGIAGFSTWLLLYVAGFVTQQVIRHVPGPVVERTHLSNYLASYPGYALSAFFISTTIALRGLTEAALSVKRALDRGDLARARRELGKIVGRDTARLPVDEIVRGTVETVAENTVDAVISPLFYAFLGGAPLAMTYRAVNTLDSMIGYRNKTYVNLGWASAKLDDLANYIPARVAGVALVAAAWLTGKDAQEAWRIIRRDARKHPSPNGGIPESAVAGALRVRLGGVNYYQGVPSHRGHLGDPDRPLQPSHIDDAIRLLYVASAIALILGVVASCILSYIKS